MTTTEFFADLYEQPHSEFLEHELTKIFQTTTTQDEFFDLDVPF